MSSSAVTSTVNVVEPSTRTDGSVSVPSIVVAQVVTPCMLDMLVEPVNADEPPYAATTERAPSTSGV